MLFDRKLALILTHFDIIMLKYYVESMSNMNTLNMNMLGISRLSSTVAYLDLICTYYDSDVNWNKDFVFTSSFQYMWCDNSYIPQLY